REKGRFPSWFQELIDELASISRSLRKERELALYGDEEAGIPPEEFYTRMDAAKALEEAERVYYIVVRLLSEIRVG
ncbi:MAG: DNA-binding protein, partial [Nitrososphaerota archaeon]|nr:DNA-binding protein [Nitrososphaerota archaeon]